jgi:hypothetical protein
MLCIVLPRCTYNFRANRYGKKDEGMLYISVGNTPFIPITGKITSGTYPYCGSMKLYYGLKMKGVITLDNKNLKGLEFSQPPKSRLFQY